MISSQGKILTARAIALAVFVDIILFSGIATLLLGQGVLRFQVGAIPSYGDLVSYFLPFWKFFRESLNSGQLPVWECSQSFGFFFLGNPQCGLFHVPNYLLLLPESFGYTVYILAPYFLAGLGLFRISRSRGTPPIWAMLQAWITVGNPLSLALHTMPTATWTIAWLPWLYRYASRERWLLAGLCVGQSFLAGAWDIWAGAMLGLLPVLWSTNVLRSVRFWIGAVALLPTQLIWSWILLSQTSRGAGLTASQSIFWAADVQHFLGLFSPRVELSSFGAGAWYSFWGKRQSWLMATYIGLWAMIFAPLLLGRIRRKYFVAFVINLGMAVLSFLPSIPWVRGLLEAANVRAPVRYPDKLLIFPLLMFAFYGFGMLRSHIRWVGCRNWRILATGAWVATMGLAIYPLLKWQASIMGVESAINTLFRDFYFAEVWGDFVTVAGLYGVLLCVLLLGGWFRTKAGILLWGLLACGEVCFNGTQWGNFTRLPNPNSAGQALSTNGYRLLDTARSVPGLVRPAPRLQIGRLTFWERLEAFPFLSLDSGIAITNLNNVLVFSGPMAYQNLLGSDPRRDSALFWRAGITHLIAFGPNPTHMYLAPFCEEIHVSLDTLASVCQRPAAPLVRLVTQATFVGDQNQVARILDSVSVPAEVVLIEQHGLDRVVSGGRVANDSGRAEIRRWSNGRFEATIETKASGWAVFLVPATTILKASVDGVPRPILKADLAFSAIYLKPGRHEVKIHPAAWILWLLPGHLLILLVFLCLRCPLVRRLFR